MDQQFGKSGKLKRYRDLRKLFAEGTYLNEYPVKLVYCPIEETVTHKVGVTVSKRRFSRAVDRNRIKRLMRESYRLNKGLIKDIEQPLAVMLIYTGPGKMGFISIEASVKKLLIQLTIRTRR